MSTGRRRHRSLLSGGAVALTLLAGLGPFSDVCCASGPPILGAAWTSTVQSSTARLSAEINPNELFSSYHFDYIAKVAYYANVGAAKEPFTGAARVPATFDANVGSGSGAVTVLQILTGLSPDTPYRYRVVAKNSAGTTTGATHDFATQSTGGASVLLDSRGWEMVSPPEKNGGQVEPPGALAGGGVLQAATGAGSVTYGSSASFGAGAGGAPPASQYVATRGPGGWATQNITAPLFSGSYDAEDGGVPYQLFSPDLARGLLLNGDHCRGGASGCAVANPPLPGSAAPAGYQNYYLRDNSTATFAALLSSADAANLDLDPAHFDLSLAGAAPDLRHVVLSSCAALTAEATEVPLGEGCDPDRPNLYEYSSGGGLSLINILPAQTQGAPGAALGAEATAVSADGSRVYWADLASGNLYLREEGQTQQVDTDAGGGGTFETASVDGSVAFYTRANHLYRYEALGPGTSTDLTPSGGVTGVLGASEDGSHVYYLTASGLFLRNGATTTKVAAGGDPSNYPSATGTARVSADGAHLLFVSSAALGEYDNTDLNTGDLDSQVYLYDAGADLLTCVSCNPTGERPIGPSTIPGATANGAAPGSTHSYKPRVLSADGRRVFFDSRDALALTDTNNDADAYEWEAQGKGSCARPGGCIALVSSGRAAGGASFVDASADGADVFFLTDGSLVGGDPGAVDLYDARVGGGFPEPSPPIVCEGDNCQSLPPTPIDPTLTTLLSGPGNPPVRYRKVGKRCKTGFVKRKGKCVRKPRKPHHRRSGR